MKSAGLKPHPYWSSADWKRESARQALQWAALCRREAGQYEAKAASLLKEAAEATPATRGARG
jgi:hypothetical protein